MAKLYFDVLHKRGQGAKATLDQQMEAAEWLTSRYAGRAVDVSVTADMGDADNPLALMATEELKALIRVSRGLAPSAGPAVALSPSGGENATHSHAHSHTLSAGTPDALASAAPSLGGDMGDAVLEPLATPPATPIVVPSAFQARCALCGLRRAHNLDCPNRPVT